MKADAATAHTRLAQFFEGVQLPTLPEVAHTLVSTLNDEDVPFEKVRQAISRDPALTAKLIRLANSARFGLPRQVVSLDDAITMAGLNQVRTLAMAACLASSFAAVKGVDSKAFWQASSATAGYAQWLARTLGTDVQQSWLAGFMVRLGELIIAQKLPDQIFEIERLPHLAGVRWERETSALGFTEAHVAAELARRWNFPDSIVLALRSAADPLAAEPFNRLGAIVHVAALLAELELDEHKSAADAIAALPAELVQTLQLDPVWLVEHMPDVKTFLDDSFV
ncbi:HDOD domain-containing protein [Xylophilus rhododendri]|uniref:HDOD domain-containing protein n=1 Tax=Xylophilus rhododendri TaxID=2697032 RepID=A0A857J7U8_9BURK|nr:HDOD domain-containing protein [Xylophilus rhododendri]QHI99787.1 HDOD domain-containing protein [Xylophilus rhododendri]